MTRSFFRICKKISGMVFVGDIKIARSDAVEATHGIHGELRH